MLKESFDHQANLGPLNHEGTLQGKLTSIHEVITATFPYIDRIAVAVYEKDTDTLKTFVASCIGDNPLRHYEDCLGESETLQMILEKGQPCVVNDLDIFSQKNKPHRRIIAGKNYAASYAMPIYQHGKFFGFVFFNSIESDVFEQDTLYQMDLFGHMISLMVMSELIDAYTQNDSTDAVEENSNESTPDL